MIGDRLDNGQTPIVRWAETKARVAGGKATHLLLRRRNSVQENVTHPFFSYETPIFTLLEAKCFVEEQNLALKGTFFLFYLAVQSLKVLKQLFLKIKYHMRGEAGVGCQKRAKKCQVLLLIYAIQTIVRLAMGRAVMKRLTSPALWDKSSSS